MVYCGKPSVACYMCRHRRIKCDKKRPGCTQCSSRSIDCPGYRNLLDQYFRDESDTVIRKAQASYDISPGKRRRSSPSERGKLKQTHSPGSIASHFQETGFFQDAAVPVIWSNPVHSIQDIGISYFMSTYITGSHFEYLPELYRTSSINSPLSIIIDAVSLVSLSQELGEPSLMETARSRYSTGLAMTNTALGNATSAVQDSTLVSVLLLSLFEAIMYDGICTPNNWYAHTQGALALVKLRGRQQLQTDLGRRLFFQVGNSIHVSCIQRNLRLPPELVELVSIARLFYEDDNPRMELGALVEEVTEFLATMYEGGLTALEAVQSAMHIDQKYVSLAQRIPSAWQYTKICAGEAHPGSYERIIHQYPNHQVAKLWNSCRMIRILLNEIVHHFAVSVEQTASSLYNDSTTLQQRAAWNVEQMAIEICASIPQLANPLGLVPAKACAASLLWPLSSVRGTSLAPDSARVYAIEQLRYLGRELKLMHAVRVAEATWEVNPLEDGLHMFYLS